MPISYENLTRISVFLNRKKGTTEEEFYNYWANVHGLLVSNWLLRSGIVKYVQYHTPSTFKSLSSGRETSKYDGIADFYVRKYEDWENAFKDPEYVERIREDELRFIDLESAVVTVGCEVIVFDEGRNAEKD